MREIVLDTETTGLDPMQGDRIVEIGGVELVNHLPTGRVYHQYINPERSMPMEAFNVHGLGDDFLRDKPVFKAVAQAFVDFVGDAVMVIHNASFDMRFINAELQWCGMPVFPDSQALDTLALARRRFPGAQHSLDALCRRFGIDNSAREKHGALLDADLLSEVYLDLIGGRQRGLSLDAMPGRSDAGVAAGPAGAARVRPEPLAPRITAEERAAHEAFIEEMGEAALWRAAREAG